MPMPTKRSICGEALSRASLRPRSLTPPPPPQATPTIPQLAHPSGEARNDTLGLSCQPACGAGLGLSAVREAYSH